MGKSKQNRGQGVERLLPPTWALKGVGEGGGGMQAVVVCCNHILVDISMV